MTWNAKCCSHVATYTYYDSFGSASMFCLLVFCMCTKAHLIFVKFRNNSDSTAHLRARSGAPPVRVSQVAPCCKGTLHMTRTQWQHRVQHKHCTAQSCCHINYKMAECPFYTKKHRTRKVEIHPLWKQPEFTSVSTDVVLIHKFMP